MRIAVNNLAGVPSIVFGVFGLGFFVYGVGGSLDPFFFAEPLPTPTFGTGGILWASLTLALLTVPVVIVATEEGLAAVPRDGARGFARARRDASSRRCWRVVLPAALPGMLTGLILAMARAAGEVAPLMIVGMVKLAPSFRSTASSRSCTWSGSSCTWASTSTTWASRARTSKRSRPWCSRPALLILMVVSINLTAILLRNHLRRRLAGRGV